jgi:pilus assembly protein Flp/PilA
MVERRLRARSVLLKLHREESGQDLVEYAMVAALIALAATAGMGFIARQVNEVFLTLANKFQNSV